MLGQRCKQYIYFVYTYITVVRPCNVYQNKCPLLKYSVNFDTIFVRVGNENTLKIMYKQDMCALSIILYGRNLFCKKLH